MVSIVVEDNLTVAGDPGVGFEAGRPQRDRQFECLDRVLRLACAFAPRWANSTAESCRRRKPCRHWFIVALATAWGTPRSDPGPPWSERTIERGPGALKSG